MKIIQKNIKNLNTFGIDLEVKEFISLTDESDFSKLSELNKQILLLGGGSNILFTEAPKECVVHIETKGKSIVKQDDSFVYIEVASGENWHEFVLWCIDQNYGGLENLSLIPGNVGTAPIQNIGAYGVEVKDCIISVSGYGLETGKPFKLKNKECDFGYRNSIFKNELKGKTIISSVVFKLTKKAHQINTSYGVIKAKLSSSTPSIRDVSNAVITIRKEKLPDPNIIGNAGSFFKNPIIPNSLFRVLKERHPELPSYPSDDGVKIPAGWLIDKCGLKGYELGGASVHKKQALVLINKSGKATGNDILSLAKYVQKTVRDNYEIELEMEVNIYPQSFR